MDSVHKIKEKKGYQKDREGVHQKAFIELVFEKKNGKRSSDPEGR